MGKLLALSAGRRNSNTDMYVKTALKEAKKMGAEVEMIRLADCNLNPCKACNKMMCMPLGPKACIFKDDAAWLYDKYLECDSLILAAPVWDLSPAGIITVLRDRIWGPRAARTSFAMNGGVPDWSKEHDIRPGALISVGGALTENWTSLGLATLYSCVFPEPVRVIDHMNVYGVADPGEALMRKDYMRHARYIGQNLTYAMNYPDSGWKKGFWGKTEQEEACPGCHQSLVIARPGKDYVECAICGRKGYISMENGGLKYNWPEFDPDDRLTELGVLNHLREIEYHTTQIYEPQYESIKEEYEKLKKEEVFIVKPPRH